MKLKKYAIRGLIIFAVVVAPVSYTHLDVYKRQVWICAAS